MPASLAIFAIRAMVVALDGVGCKMRSMNLTSIVP
jgi:hypothetical protein